MASGVTLTQLQKHFEQVWEGLLTTMSVPHSESILNSTLVVLDSQQTERFNNILRRAKISPSKLVEQIYYLVPGSGKSIRCVNDSFVTLRTREWGDFTQITYHTLAIALQQLIVHQ